MAWHAKQASGTTFPFGLGARHTVMQLSLTPLQYNCDVTQTKAACSGSKTTSHVCLLETLALCRSFGR